jgi:hypothetical protein
MKLQGYSFYFNSLISIIISNISLLNELLKLINIVLILKKNNNNNFWKKISKQVLIGSEIGK